MEVVEETLDRLISLGKCDCKNVKDYIEQLSKMEKDDDIEKAKRRSKYYRALGDVNRQRILNLLMIRDMCVFELQTALDISQSTTSHHLKILEKRNIILNRKEGKWVFYSISNKTTELFKVDI